MLSKADTELGSKFGKEALENTPSMNIQNILNEARNTLENLKVTKNVKVDPEVIEASKNRLTENTKRLLSMQEELKGLQTAKEEARQISKFAPTEIEQTQAANKLSELSNRESELLSNIKSTQQDTSQIAKSLDTNTTKNFSPEMIDEANKVQEYLEKVQNTYGDISNAPYEIQQKIKEGLNNFRTMGDNPIENYKLKGIINDIVGNIDANLPENVANIRSNLSKIKTAEDLVGGKPSQYLDKAVLDKITSEAEAGRLGKVGAAAEKQKKIYNKVSDLANEAGYPEIANQASIIKEAAENKAISDRMNASKLYEYAPEKIVGNIGEAIHTGKQLPGQAIDKILDNKFTGPVLKKLDEIALQNKYSQTVIDTVKKNLSLQDQNKRKAAINIMMQSPTYRRLVKEIAGVEDGEQIK